MIIALNNKSNMTRQEFIEYQKELSDIKVDVKMILCPLLLHHQSRICSCFRIRA